jgi:hypothetical protein
MVKKYFLYYILLLAYVNVAFSVILCTYASAFNAYYVHIHSWLKRLCLWRPGTRRLDTYSLPFLHYKTELSTVELLPRWSNFALRPLQAMSGITIRESSLRLLFWGLFHQHLKQRETMDCQRYEFLLCFNSKFMNSQFQVILSNSMEPNFSWEANKCSATEELPSILWNRKVHYWSLAWAR